MRTICWNNLKKCHQISMMIIAKIVLLVATFLQIQLLPIIRSKMAAPETETVKILGKLPTFSRLCKTTLLLRWQQIMKAIRPTVDADVYQESVSLFCKKKYIEEPCSIKLETKKGTKIEIA